MKHIFFAAICTLLAGCVTAPINDADFGNVNSVFDIQGTYQNSGERGSNGVESPIYLSTLIWPNHSEIKHAAIELVEVRAISPKSVVVRALEKNLVVKEETFTEGEQFEFHNGRIRLNLEVRIAGFRRGEPVVGPVYESVELGIDKDGNGKRRSDGAFVGLVYLMFPLAIAIREDVRFVKIAP